MLLLIILQFAKLGWNVFWNSRCDFCCIASWRKNCFVIHDTWPKRMKPKIVMTTEHVRGIVRLQMCLQFRQLGLYYWQQQPILSQDNNKYYFKIYGRDSCYVKKRRFDRLRRSVYFYGTQYYNTRQCNLNFFCVAHIREKWKQRLQWRSLPRYICRLSCFWAVSGCK